MWRKAVLPVVEAKITGHFASKLRAIVHPAIAQNGLRILLKGRGQGRNFSWGSCANLKTPTFFRNFFQKGGFAQGSEYRLEHLKKWKDTGLRGTPSHLAKD